MDDDSDALSQRVDAAIAEFLDAVKRGEAPHRAAFLAQHPEIAADLAQFLDDHGALDAAAQHIAGSTASNIRSTAVKRGGGLPSLQLPCAFGEFELLAEVARGGMGVVYQARQTNPDRIVALKMILAGRFASADDVKRFYTEAQAAAALDHPHIVPIFAAGEHEGQHYFTMALVDGQSLAQRLSDGPLPAKEAAAIVREVALAVEYAHQHGVVHRDLKPANILMDASGRVRVTDFGLAKRQTDDSGITGTGQLLGTPNFMSPEQVAGVPGQIGQGSDVYSLGATLYALLTGRPPFQAASTLETLRQVSEREPVPPHELDVSIPRDLETVVLKALAKDPASRYRTAEALADDLGRFLSDRPVLARRAGTPERLLRWCRRNPAVAALSATAALALLAGTTISTSLAVRAIRAERVAQDRARAEAEQRQAVEAQRSEAEKQRAAADANFKQAVATVERYFTLVSQSTLFDVPGLEPLRKDLLEGALEFYEQAAARPDADPALLADAAVAQLRVSGVYLALGRLDDSVTLLKKATQSVERLLRDYPNAHAAHRRLAGFWNGTRYVTARLGVPKDIVGAMQALLHFEGLWQKLAERYPDEPAFQGDLASYEQLIGQSWETTENLAASEAAFRKAYDILQRLIPDHPEVVQYRAELGLVVDHLSRIMHKRGGHDAEATAMVRAAVKQGEALVAEFPDVVTYRYGLSMGKRRLALFLMPSKPREADQLVREAVEVVAPVVRKYPGHALIREFWQAADALLYERAVASGKPAVIEAALHSRIRLQELLLAYGEDDLSRFELVKSLRQLAKQVQKEPKRAAEAEAIDQRVGRLLKEYVDAPRRDRTSDLGAWEAFALTLSSVATEPLHDGLTRERLLGRAIEVHTDLADEFPLERGFYEQIGHLHRWLSGAAYIVGNGPKATEHAQAAIQVFERLSQADIAQRDGHYRSFLADTCANIVVTLGQIHRPEDGLAMARRSIELYRELVADFPEIPAYQDALQRAQAIMGRHVSRYLPPAEAEAELRKLATGPPPAAGLYQWLAELLVKQGRIEDAKAAIEMAVQVESHDEALNNDLAWFLATCEADPLRNLTQAVRLAQRAVDNQPDSSQYLNTLGVAYCRDGQWEEAIARLERSESLAPESSLPYNGLFLAISYWQLGQPDAARRWYDRSVDWIEKRKAANPEMARFRAEAARVLQLPDPAPFDSPQASKAP